MATHKQYLFGRVDADGRLTLDDNAAFARVRASLRGLNVQILIERKAKPRSLEENGYYWGVVIPLIGEWAGYTADETHEALKAKFLSRFDNATGLTRLRSTANLTTTEFEEYMSDIRQWAAEQGCFIPLPNEEIY